MIKSVLSALIFVLAATTFASAQYDTIPRPADRPVIIQQQPLDENYQEEVQMPWKSRPFKDKLRYGVNITTPSLSFFGGSSFFGFDISPMGGIRVTPTTTAGLGVTYSYSSGPDYITNRGRQKISLLGGRIFLQQHLNFIDNIIPGLFLWGEAEQYQVLSYKNSNGSIKGYEFEPGFLIGGGYGAPAGEPGFQISILYHTNYNTNPNTYSSSGSPLVIRFGYWFK